MDMTQMAWRKASRSTAQADNCVEVAVVQQLVAIRDSKDPSGPMVTVSRQEFRRFSDALKHL